MEDKLSNQAVNNAVLKKTMQHPVSVYPFSLGVLGGVAATIFGTNPITLGILGAGLVFGVGGFSAKYLFQKDKIANEYMQNIRQKMIEERNHKLKGLEKNLSEVSADSGIRQIDLFREKYDNLLSILDTKMTPGEFTHTRYLTIAEQVFLAGLDNLENLALALKSISTIDIKHIEQEIDTKGEKCESATIKALMGKKSLYYEQHERANSLLEQNEIALTHLDHVTAKLANIKTDQGHAVLDIEDAMGELTDLIHRVDKYSS